MHDKHTSTRPYTSRPLRFTIIKYVSIKLDVPLYTWRRGGGGGGAMTAVHTFYSYYDEVIAEFVTTRRVIKQIIIKDVDYFFMKRLKRRLCC